MTEKRIHTARPDLPVIRLRIPSDLADLSSPELTKKSVLPFSRHQKDHLCACLDALTEYLRGNPEKIPSPSRRADPILTFRVTESDWLRSSGKSRSTAFTSHRREGSSTHDRLLRIEAVTSVCGKVLAAFVIEERWNPERTRLLEWNTVPFSGNAP